MLWVSTCSSTMAAEGAKSHEAEGGQDVLSRLSALMAECKETKADHFVTLTYAQSLDGSISDEAGVWLRGRHFELLAFRDRNATRASQPRGSQPRREDDRTVLCRLAKDDTWNACGA